MIIRYANENDVQSLMDIYNYEVINGVATLDLQAKDYEDRLSFYKAHQDIHHPLIVGEIDGKVVGYACLSSYREKEAFKATVELSVYIHQEHRGKHVASKLMEYILEIAKKDETIHNVVSVITAGNVASTRLHEKFNFTYCGTIKEVGIKFGKYQDIENYSLLV